MKNYDFSGWATRNNIRCSDGRTIMKDAFSDCDGKVVPLVWNHNHTESESVLGHALLENRDEGVYAYCSFNETDSGNNARKLVEHGDVCALSIYANQLKERAGSVFHGMIREVSLVLAGANPGAFIDSVIQHSDGTFSEDADQAIIYSGEEIMIKHADEEPKKETQEQGKTVKEVYETLTDDQKEFFDLVVGTVADGGTIDDIDESEQEKFTALNEDQKQLLVFMMAQAKENKGNNTNSNNEEEPEMKHNVFDSESNENDQVISHSEMMAVIGDAKRYGSMRESCIQHGIEHLDYLFPDDQTIDNKFHFISRDMKWVGDVMNGVHHTKMSRLKCIFADITGEDARALGYQKGNLKKEEMFTLLKRTTEPTTVYKKQKFDRDDLIDITDFDVVSEVKGEMRTMLNEEIARAILLGDGRPSSSDDKIDELKIRPVWTDNDFYTIHSVVAPTAVSPTDTDKALEMIDQFVRAMDDYKGSGNLVFFCDRKWLTAALLAKDTQGYRLYKSVNDIATAMMVDKIVPVPLMANKVRTDGSYNYTLMGIGLDLNDYNVGADKGGEVSLFDDFDIDYNAQKYLIETRVSGSLVKPYSAIALELKASV